MTTPTTPVFAPTSTKLTVLERHDPDLFYRTRSGLLVSKGFCDLVVAKANPTEAGTTFQVIPRTMVRDASDAEIELELGGETKIHLFDETRVSVIVARLIDGQPKGEAGLLLNNGYANLFYTSSCVVVVRWSAVRRRWGVGTWGRDDGRWRAGFRVFSPAN